ncbi:hypothetical protein Vafri_15322 [Volvox africanus]|uniref:Uncharacterized protein n=1 Tax=Volvox africanus TaxID=51714 RepID=A0A8J4BL12_9CHLO|nr:hypothetical protein Vafri_15322 [Volvox africanus]
MIKTETKLVSKAANASFRKHKLKNSSRPDIFARQHSVMGPRMLAAQPTVVTSPEMIEKSIHGLSTEPHNATQVVGDSEIFSTQALVADYQYALRYYRALKWQVGAWQSAFASAKGRHPTLEDAADHGGHQFALLYSSFLEVRTRLLVELPRLRERMLCDEDMDKDGQHAKPGWERGSVNANSSAPGLVGVPQSGGRDAPAPNSDGAKHPQIVDSVSTWLRADRYRRQRAVAATAVLDTSPGVASTQTPLDALPLHSAGLQENVAASRLQQHPAAAAANRSSSDGAPWVAYQPTIPLTPLSECLRAAAQQQVQGQIPDGISVPSLSVLPCGEEDVYGQPDSREGPSDPALVPQWPVISLAAPSSDGAMHGEGWREQKGTGAAVAEGRGQEGRTPAGAHITRAAGGSPEALQDAGTPSGHVARLVEDASLAADSRARNALFAALQYKRAGRTAGSASRGGTEAAGHGDDGAPRGAPDGVIPAGSSGNGATGLRDPGSGVVVGEVRRGDAVGVYEGRNRLADALPEAFLVCP